MEGFCTGAVSCGEAIASLDGLENAHDMEGASMDIDEVSCCLMCEFMSAG